MSGAGEGNDPGVYDVDLLGLLTREVLRERVPELVAEACAWSVGLSDEPHLVRRHGRVVPGSPTLGVRAEAGLPLGGEEDARLELGEVVPGSFADALNALQPDGRVHAERFDDQVLAPFCLTTCLRAVQRAQALLPAEWHALLDELGEDGSDPVEVVRATEWEAPLRTEAGHLVLAALGHVPLVEVEAEGLPLSLVRAAEAVAAAAAPTAPLPGLGEAELAGALFLAENALQEAELAVPVPPTTAGVLLEALLREGLEPDEVLAVLPHLPVLADTADAVAVRLRELDPP